MKDIIEFQLDIYSREDMSFEEKVATVAYRLAALEMETNSWYAPFKAFLEKEGSERSMTAAGYMAEIMGEEDKHDTIFKQIGDSYGDIEEEG